MKKFLCFATTLLLVSSFKLILAQDQNEVGRPFMTTFTTKDHTGDLQTWAFVQDPRGVIYAGNQPGTMEYDGATWRMIPTPNNSFVRSLDIDSNGRIYVGAQSDFGYLAPDSTGQLHNISLLEYVNEEDRNFTYIWTTHVTDKGIYFQANERLFRLTPNGDSWTVKVWKPKDKFNFAFYIDGIYYVHQSGIGLSKMIDDSLHLLPGGEQFANQRLQVMLPYEYNGSSRATKFLVGPFNGGLFLFDGSSFQRFKTEADDFFKSNTLYDGRILSDGTFGLATITNGFVNIDRQGKVLQYLNWENGLASNSVLSIFVDRDGELWLGPENGIHIVDMPSPLSRFTSADGLDGGVFSVQRHHGILYVGTSTGVYYLDNKTAKFKPINGLLPGNPQAFWLMSFDDQLLATLGTGLYGIEGNQAIIIKKNIGLSFLPGVIERSLQDRRRIFIGMFDGLVSMRFDDQSKRWVYEGKIEGIHEYISTIAEVKPGELWLGTNAQGVIRVTFNDHSLLNPRIERFGSEDGLLSEGGSSVRIAAGKVAFITAGGIFQFDELTGKFIPGSLLNVVSFTNKATNYAGVNEDQQGNLWVNFGAESAVLRKQADGSYQTEKLAFQRFSDSPVTAIYPEENGVVWFGATDALIRYDPSVKKNYNADFLTLIRRVTIGEDSVIYGGAAFPNNRKEQSRPRPAFAYDFNAMRFEFAAPTFDNPKEIQYQSMLEGFDERWSAWSKENKRDYTNLPYGDYKFHVHAKNIYQHPGAEAVYEFKILAPWYRTWWAYITYGLLFIALIFAGDRVQRRRLIRKERQRAQLREAELRAKEAEAKSKAAEAEAKVLQTENERKKNIELLSEIGKNITATLSTTSIIDTVYENVNALMDATVFGIGIFNEENQSIDFPASKEKGETLASFSHMLKDENRPSVWCFKNQKELFSNDYVTEYHKYIKLRKAPVAGKSSASLIYLPLTNKDRKLGVITAQSYKKDAYTDYHLNILRNLATYTAIALDNADAYRKLNSTVEQLNKTLDDLKATQQQLITQEKLASLGALTAGIAHEIKNPLNFVNNFADLSVELVEELREDLEKQKDKLSASDFENLEDILLNLEQNARKINEHGKRADSIVHSMLQHSRGKTGERQETDINAMLEEDLNLAYHGMRARDSSFNVTMETDFDEEIGKLNIVPQDVSRVFLNILTNSFYEVSRKKRENGDAFSPQVNVCSKSKGKQVEIRIRDNGDGIPESIRNKLFNPFFTTKPSGQGTGLGLSLSYDIIAKEHHGDITFESKEGEYTEFIITLPGNGRQ